MKMKAAVLFKDGFEELEALSVVDVLRRAQLTCLMVGMDAMSVKSSHGIEVKMDQLFDESVYDVDIVVLPGDGSYFEVLVTSKDGTPLSNVLVNITISGITYSKYTDENGIARLQINLIVGNYDVYYTVNDELYSSNNGSNKILVNGSIMTSNETTVNFGSDSYFAVQITDAYGRPIVGATIRFVISNGETLYAITDENGIAMLFTGVRHFKH